MKKIFILLITITTIFIGACDKDSYGDSYGITGESLPPLVEISSKDTIRVNEGKTATIAIRLRTALQSVTTVNYEVTGATATTGTISIPAESTTANTIITIPTGTLTGGKVEDFAIFKLISATANGENLTIGMKGPDKEVKVIAVYK